MFDGVGWAAGEIVVFMIIATLIGFAIGWIFGRWLQKGAIATEHESKLAAERELTHRAEARLSANSADLDKALLEVKAERGKLGELTAELEAAQTVSTELEAKLGELAEKDAEIERMGSELAAKAELEAKLDAEAAAKSDLEAELASANEATSDLEAKLATATAGRADLEAKLATATAGQSDLEAKLGAVTEKDAEIERLQADLESCRAERQGLAMELADSSEQIAVRDSRIAILEAEAESVGSAEVEAPLVSPATPAVVAPTDGDTPSKEEGLARIGEIAARTAGDDPIADDDLTKVHGVGPKLERTLKGLGITSFRQIANFQKDDIAFVTAALDAFKGRIERDDWMSSAAAEHMKKYNKPA